MILFCVVADLVACTNDDVLEKTVDKEEMDLVQYDPNRRSYAEALEIAQNSIRMLQDENSTARSAEPARTLDLKNGVKAVRQTVTRSNGTVSGNDTLLYIFNFEDGRGFSVVSASRRTDGLIAVTETGHYDPEVKTGNPGFDMYIYLLNSRIDNRPPTIDTTFNGFGPFYDYEILEESEVEPLLTVKWGQNQPYNLACPQNVHNTGVSPAGCVAIAIAQIMTYHEYPNSYIRKYHNVDNIVPQNIDWNDIKRHVITSSCDYSCDYISISQLIREIGYRANIRYGEYDTTTGLYQSWTYTNDAYSSILSFGYGVNSVQSYSFASIKTELNNFRPVYMSGGITGVTIGHAWVADGYYHKTERMTEYYETGIGGDRIIISETPIHTKHLHINWGWDGEGNGYFNDGVFRPSNPVSLDSPSLPSNNSGNYNDPTQLCMITGISPLD